MPATVTANPGRYAQVVVTYTGDSMAYWCDANGAAVDVLRVYDTRLNTYVLIVGGTAGTYQLHAVSAGVQNGAAVLSPAGTTIVTLTALPTPVPPTPPTPVPTPPTPIPATMKHADAFTQSLQDAYAKDVGDNKAGDLAYVLSRYREGPDWYLDKPEVKTNQDLFTALSASIYTQAHGIKPNALANTMQVIGREINAALGSGESPVNRSALLTEFDKVATALASIK
jgi:hypothetical protein